jgi:hypothetical protein
MAAGSHRRSTPVVPSRLALRWSAVPRRGVPIPLRSACAVSHDLGGFRLLGPGGVFHPLTPLGFCSLLPDACFRSADPKACLPGARPCDAYQRCGSHELRGRVFAQKIPGQLRARQLPKQPPELRGHRSPSRRRWSGFRLPLTLLNRLRFLTTEAVIRPDAGPGTSPTEVVVSRATVTANRRGLSAHSRVGVASPARADRVLVSQSTAGLAGQRIRTCDLPKETVASNPPALPTQPPLDDSAACDLPARLQFLAATPEGMVAGHRGRWRRGLKINL